jgi:hypothetical protein
MGPVGEKIGIVVRLAQSRHPLLVGTGSDPH